jgi:hypothetical protein
MVSASKGQVNLSLPACLRRWNSARGRGVKRPPRGPLAEHGIEKDHQLARAGRERGLAGLSRPAQAPVEAGDRRVGPHRRQHGHVEGRADPGPAAPDCAPAAQLAAVAAERRHPDQRRDLAAGEMPQLRQLGDQGPGRGGTDAGDGAQQGLPRAPGLAAGSGSTTWSSRTTAGSSAERGRCSAFTAFGPLGEPSPASRPWRCW